MPLIAFPNTNYNSWITEAEANAYFEDRLYCAEWIGSTEKGKALIHAFRQLNTLNIEIDLDTNAEPLSQLQAAQCEQALHLLQNDPTAPGICSVSISGGMEVKLGSDADEKELYSPQALTLLYKFMRVPVFRRTR